MSLTLRRRAALLCHALVALGLGLSGLRYLLASEPMPYHQHLLEQGGLAVPPSTQQLVLALVHGAGAAMLAGALALGLLVAIPWRRGERWARHAVPVLALCGLGPLFVVTLRLGALGASTPRFPVAAAVALTLLGWALGCDLPEAGAPAKMADRSDDSSQP
jgi:hypothetical protein